MVELTGHAAGLANETEPPARRPRRRLLPTVPALLAIGVAGLLSLPILTVASFLFRKTDLLDHLAETVLLGYVVNTLWMMVLVPAGTAVIGVGCAWLVAMCRFPGRRLFEWALVLPLAAPAYVLAYVYTDFLQHSGAVQTGLRSVTGWGPRDYWFPEIRSLPGAIAMFVLTLYPYVYLLARAAFLEQSVCVLEVSRTLGQSAFGAFRRVALPLARPAIATGVALALMETLADFGTVAHFGVQTFTTGIYRALYSFGDPVAAAQLSTGLLAFVLLLIGLERASRGRRGFQNSTGVYNRLPGYRLTGWRAAAAIGACALPLTLGFLLPGGLLLHMAITDGHDLFDARYLRLVQNSFVLAGTAALCAVLLSLLLAYANRIDRSPLARGAVRLASMGYAIPGTVVAVGLVIALGGFDNALDGWMRATFDLSTGLLLTGGIVALVFAYMVRFMAVSLNTVESGLGRVTRSMDDAARCLGRGPVATVREVHVPIVSGSLLTAGLIVFVDVMKELPATLILRPFNFDTLAIQAYNLASDERLTEASTASLMIVLVGLLPMILLSRQIAKSRPGHGTCRAATD